jgi:alginate production protein
MTGWEKRISNEEEERIQFSGVGVDGGVILKSRTFLNPSVIFSIALGTGEKSNPRKGGFRQTGLQDNSDKLLGYGSVRYYGELLDPELHNIFIFTTGLSVKLFGKCSLEGLFHYYQQYYPSNEVRDARIDADPKGTHPEIGNEVDINAVIKDIGNFDLEVKYGIFTPGPAFPKDEVSRAEQWKIKVRYSF